MGTTFKLLAVTLLTIIAIGCGKAANRMALPPLKYGVVKLFYATDRQPVSGSSSLKFYGGERSENDQLVMGVCEVSIPRLHQVGKLERPSILKLEFSEDPEKHVVLLGAVQQSYEDFYSEMRGRISPSLSKEAFVFIHGYKVSFEDAALRTAQLAYDLKRTDTAVEYDITPILYSWPSKGELASYGADEDTVIWTTPHLRWFLEDLATKSGATKIHLIAHSMGNRALTSALNTIATEARATIMPRFQQIVLAAPDIGLRNFKQLADVIQKPAEKITLYASSEDEPLRASKKFHEEQRAGDSGKNLTVFRGIDSIDVASVGGCLLCFDRLDPDLWLGHSYYANNPSVISDLMILLKEGKPPSQRPQLVPHTRGYWEFRPTKQN